MGIKTIAGSNLMMAPGVPFGFGNMPIMAMD